MSARLLPLFVPRKRADCERVPRPCPWITCRHHLERDDQKLYGNNRGNCYPENMARRRLAGVTATCALDVAEDGPLDRNEVARILGVSSERVRQIEEEAIRKLRDE